MKKMIYGLFFGDSITYGEYDGLFGGWVDLLKRYALQKYSDENKNEVILFNLGIGGETTEGLVKRIPHEMKARNSSDGNIIFIAYGANDLAVKDGQQMVSSNQFRANIETAVQDAELYSKDIYLISILPISENIDSKISVTGKIRTNEDVLLYNEILRDIAAENSLNYVDFHSAFIDQKEILLSKDGVHPNENGYKMMAEIAIPIIEKYL
jgi:acyl-CoA thioesterase-1